MINRTKIASFVAVAALSAAVLTGCGGSASSAPSSVSTAAAESPASSAAASSVVDNAAENGTIDLDSIVSSLLKTNTISNQFEIDPISIEYDFQLKAEDIVSYKGVKSNDNGDAGLVIAVEAADGKVQNVIDGMNTYKQQLIDNCSNYPAEFAQALENANNAIIASNGNLVIMVVNSNECSADLNSAVDSALNS